MLLDAVEGRVAGSLVEKQLTTPQQYPLSLNSLTLACNQTSNRDPVVSFGEAEVEAALTGLKEKSLVRFILPSHGRSVVRYRHVLDEKLGLDTRLLSLLALLLLRGPQTVGELRGRTERMARFDSLDEVESDLQGLARRQEPLVGRLTRRPGQKEERWAQLLADGGEVGVAIEPETSAVRAGLPERIPAEDLRAELDTLRQEVAELREEVLGLRLELEDRTPSSP